MMKDERYSKFCQKLRFSGIEKLKNLQKKYQFLIVYGQKIRVSNFNFLISHMVRKHSPPGLAAGRPKVGFWCEALSSGFQSQGDQRQHFAILKPDWFWIQFLDHSEKCGAKMKKPPFRVERAYKTIMVSDFFVAQLFQNL